MKKQEKIDYINKVNERFTDARNHGRNGNNWWYPTPNTIAYNVKMYGVKSSIDDVRKVMTARQNEYYSDDALYEIMQERQNDEARMFSDDIDEVYGTKSGYAGRSGGWLEVTYNNPLEDVDENTGNEVIAEQYKAAQELEKLEDIIAGRIEKAHKGLIAYMNSKEYPKDIAESLMDDDGIADIYKGRIKGLTDKLK